MRTTKKKRLAAPMCVNFVCFYKKCFVLIKSKNTICSSFLQNIFLFYFGGALDERSRKTMAMICGYCKEEASLLCIACKNVYYCGKEHQLLDWKKGHRAQCKSFEVSSI